MLSAEALKAFVYSAELGSFSAAARRLGKAHSAVSTAIANLEIDCGVALFDRSRRNPVLTAEGQVLLPHAQGILLGNREFLATANSMAEGIETHLGLLVEQGVSIKPLTPVLKAFSEKFPNVVLEIVTPSPSGSADQLRHGKADIGLMVEQEGYPSGFQFRGLGYSKMIAVCAPSHPLADAKPAGYRELRQHRQLLRHSTPIKGTTQQNEKKSPATWCVEDVNLMVDLVRSGFGWAELPVAAVNELVISGEFIRIDYLFQQNDLLEGIDLVWTERRALGIAGQWMRDQIVLLPQTTWQEVGGKS